MTALRTIGIAALATALAAAFAAAAAAQGTEPPGKPRERAQYYEETLKGLIGRPFGEVLSVLRDWKFEALAAWEAENPTPREVAGHNRNKIRFSKREIAEIFGPGGKFRVVVYNKLVATDATTIGAVDGAGMTAGKDATLNLEKFTVIRAVFKDNVLALVRVWPIMEQSGMAGGMLLRR